MTRDEFMTYAECEIDAIGEGDMRFWSSYPTPAQRKEVLWDD